MIRLVLVPGMMCDARLFGPQIAALSARRPLHLAPIAGHDSVGALAAHILASAPLRFALAGLSMGGIVAMEMLRQAPPRIARLALLDTNPMAETDAVRDARAPQIARAGAGGPDAIMREEMFPPLPRRRPRPRRDPRSVHGHGARPRSRRIRPPVPRARRPARPAGHPARLARPGARPDGRARPSLSARPPRPDARAPSRIAPCDRPGRGPDRTTAELVRWLEDLWTALS